MVENLTIILNTSYSSIIQKISKRRTAIARRSAAKRYDRFINEAKMYKAWAVETEILAKKEYLIAAGMERPPEIDRSWF